MAVRKHTQDTLVLSRRQRNTHLPLFIVMKRMKNLCYRIEAEFAPDDAWHMHPGQPVMVTFHP